MIIKIINTILKYSIGKQLVIGNRNTAIGRYTRAKKPTKQTREVIVHDYMQGDYIINL